LQPLLAHAHAIAAELVQDAWPTVAAAGLSVDSLDVHQ
jgi:hypothetical protein